MDIVTLLALTGTLVAAYVTFWFILSLLLRRNDVADIAWGLGIVLVGLIGFFTQEDPTQRMTLVTLLVTVWGARLSIRIFLKNIRKREDKRYAELAKDWGKWFAVRSYLQVFLLQGIMMLIIGYPMLHISIFDAQPLGLFALAGALVWAIGFFFEAVSDYQLDAFLRKPENKGKIMRYGLWKYSRHPNYFGEVTQWWGIFLIALAVPYGWVAIISPLLITFLITKVSGIPMLEKAFADNPEFQEYKKHTSVFFPLPPRSS